MELMIGGYILLYHTMTIVLGDNMKDHNDFFDENDEKLIEMIRSMSNEELSSIIAANVEEETDMLDILLDKDNYSYITMFDENNNEIKFQQVATIPFNKNLYAILKPIDYLDGVENDEALVFRIKQDFGRSILEIENDNNICEIVFNIYQDLIEDA
ncbi:DUF1292 domain-containing protein [bacterium]|nr:DUF1292 domain-containing protein [bacterium]